MGGTISRQRSEMMPGSTPCRPGGEAAARPGPGGSAARRSLAPASGLVRKVGQVEAVDQVAEDGEAILVELLLRGLLLFLLGDDAGPVEHLRGDEDRALETNGESDGVAGAGVYVQL